VESVLQAAPNVAGAVVYGERNPITGRIVCARVSLRCSEDPREAVRRLKQHCREKLPPFAVPVKVAVVHEVEHTERFKKRRPL